MTRRADVLVVGAGPAGLAAATAAATHGRGVMVLDDSPAAGGQIWRDGVAGARSRDDRSKRKALLAFRNSGAELLPGRRVFDASAAGLLRAVVDTGDATTAEEFTWKSLILATGARERFLPFPGWTLPGVFGVGGLQALVKGGYVVEGKRVVIAGTGPLLLAIAAHLREYGAKVVRIAEQASLSSLLSFACRLPGQPQKLLQGARYQAQLLGVPYTTHCWPVSVAGHASVKSVRLTNGRRTWDEPCDLLACGFHLVPNTELAALLGCKLEGDCVKTDAQQRTSVERIFCVGEPTGVAGIDAAAIEGRIAGLVASGHVAKAAALYRERDRERSFGLRLEAAFRLRPELRELAAPETIVCRCEDVSFRQLKGQYSWTDAKLQTRCGMGACQGRICGPAVQTLFGWRATSVRPPIFPVPLKVFLSGEPLALSREPTLQEIP